MENLSTDDQLNSTYELIANSIGASKAAKRWYAVVTYTDYYHHEKVEFSQICSDEILLLLFSNLQGEGSFITSDKFPPEACAINLKVDKYEADLQKMTYEEFLTQFIADLTDERNVNAKKNLRAFAGRLALTLLGINFLVNGILYRVPVPIVLGILQICAYACLVCSLVFNLSLGLLIPSSIILGLMTIVSIVIYSLMYKSANNESVERLSTAINSMNNELTKARKRETKPEIIYPLDPNKQTGEIGPQPGSKYQDDEKNNDNI